MYWSRPYQKGLAFAGTEFGCFVSNDDGATWTKLGGLPTIAIYDLDLQKRESDLVVASFGRGFYVLDDYSMLRTMNKEIMDKPAHLFPIKEAKLYIPSAPLGLRGTGSQGADLWAAKNPDFGATFNLYLKDVPKTKKSIRQESDKKLEKDKNPVDYPSVEDLRAEKDDHKAKLIWIITDASGKEIKRMTSSPKKGTSEVTWNLRKDATNPIQLKSRRPGRYEDAESGFLVTGGTYGVSVIMLDDAVITALIPRTEFTVKPLNNQTLVAKNPAALDQFRTQVAELNRQVAGASKLMGEQDEKLKFIKKAIMDYPNIDMNLIKEVPCIGIKNG